MKTFLQQLAIMIVMGGLLGFGCGWFFEGKLGLPEPSGLIAMFVILAARAYFIIKAEGAKTKTKTLLTLSKAESRAVDRLLDRMRGGDKGEDKTITPEELTEIKKLIKRMRRKKKRRDILEAIPVDDEE